ncbi:MAG: HYR domain-containing protein, partial [Saprospiraceae bacterium]
MAKHYLTLVMGWLCCVAFVLSPSDVSAETFGTIKGRVWNDLNNNHLQDPNEMGMSTVWVQVETSAGGWVNGSYTDMSGEYNFANIPGGGSYRVKIANPANGFNGVTPNEGNDDSIDSDVDIFGFSSVFTLAVGQTVDIDGGFTTGGQCYTPVTATVSNIQCVGGNQFTFQITATGGTAFGGQSWGWNYPAGGLMKQPYGQPVTVGPFSGCNGTVTATISDVDNPFCTATVSAEAPANCCGGPNLTFNCQNNITVTATPGANGTVVTFNAPTATTTCPGGATTVTQISGPASGSVFPLGTTEVCFKATDNCGNEKTCCFNVTVNPGTSTLTFNCQNNITVTAAPGANGTVVTFNAPTATTTCPGGATTVTQISGPASGSVFPLGTTQVCFKATDNCGNEKTCCFNVTVNPGGGTPDCETITFTPTATNSNTGQITIGNLTAPIVLIQVFNASWAQVFNCVGNCNTPTQVVSGLPVGTYYVKVDYLTANWSPICTKQLYVTIPPGNSCDNVTNGGTIGSDATVCPGNVFVSLSSLSLPTGGTGTIEYQWISSTTGCPTGIGQAIAGATSATYSPGSLTQTTWYVRLARRAGCTDWAGASNCVKITVSNLGCGNTTIICPNNINVTAAVNQTTAVVTYPDPQISTTCTGSVNVTRTSGLASGSAFPIGTTQVCFKATDDCGNEKTCCFTVTVTPQTSITFNCQNNITTTTVTGTAIVYYTAPTATTTCPNGGATVTRISGPASGSAFPVGTTQVCFKATDNCGNEKTCCFTVTVTSCPTPPNTVCFVSPTKPHVSAQITTVDNGSTLTIRTTFSKGFVDNTYGTNAIGWSGGHKFNDLVGSDQVQLALYNGAGTKSLEFKIDYISASNSAPSGYKSLGVSGGEGKMLVGSASSIISATTSLDVNFNQYGYVLTTNSPATNASYAPNPTYPNWIYEVWYEVTVSKSAFGASGYGRPEITSVHASPSKTGSNTEVVVPTPCPVTPP